jgi:hypothetical protein
MLSKLAVRRLTKLADYMADLPPEANKHFHMAGAGPLVLHGKRDLLKCGSSACAMGWAATIPSFRRAGWTSGWENEQAFFDINNPSAHYLFYCSASSANTPKQWAERCRKFLRDNA